MTPPEGISSAPRLSKSSYLSCLQCHRRLYLEVHSPELASPADEQLAARLEMGTQIGELARGCFPGGVLVDLESVGIPGAIARTSELMAAASVPAIFEGMFAFEDVRVRVDILERVGGNAWRLIEVKSSTQVKDDHLDDVAIQAYVLAGAGILLERSELMHINKDYVYPGGSLDLGQLFLRQDVTPEVAARQTEIPGRLAAMREMLAASSPPAIEPDHHCFDPYECPFWDHCTKIKPARWVFYLPGGKRTFRELVSRGIQTIDEIPAGFRLSGIQQRMKDNVEWIGPGLKRALASVQYPIHHLDFETFMPAIPKYPNTRPYQIIPFQWSNHIINGDGQVRHEEYLCTDPKDPREEFALTLLESIGREGIICVYSGYEARILKELADAFPRFQSDINRAIERFWDLLSVIRTHYYHPGFEGSFSIKSVLPAVVPGLGYDDLEIQEGSMASLQYYRMIFEVTDEEEKARLRTALLKYCERDTLAMVELRKALLVKAAQVSSR
jgi:predicted RecB family nuclease